MPDAPPNDGSQPLGAPSGVYRAADREFFIEITTDRLWIDFCRAAGLDEVAADPRFVTAAARERHRDKLNGLLDNLFASLPAEEWLRLCDEAGVPAGLAAPP